MLVADLVIIIWILWDFTLGISYWGWGFCDLMVRNHWWGNLSDRGDLVVGISWWEYYTNDFVMGISWWKPKEEESLIVGIY